MTESSENAPQYEPDDALAPENLKLKQLHCFRRILFSLLQSFPLVSDILQPLVYVGLGVTLVSENLQVQQLLGHALGGFIFSFSQCLDLRPFLLQCHQKVVQLQDLSGFGGQMRANGVATHWSSGGRMLSETDGGIPV